MPRARFYAAAQIFISAVILGQREVTNRLKEEILNTPIQTELSGRGLAAISFICTALTAIGEVESAHALLSRTEAVKPDDSDDQVMFIAGLRGVRAYLQLLTGKLADAFRSLAEGQGLMDRVSARQGRHVARVVLAPLAYILGYRAWGSRQMGASRGCRERSWWPSQFR